ncbi:MAG: ROK family protein [Bryobacteraceae bacterium]|nr:ROK family protein [Bryobacteraceae bacterium]
MKVVGVDIGRTKIAAGCVSGGGALLASSRIPALSAEGFEMSFAQVLRAIESHLSADVAGIGVCAPGPLDPRRGVILNPPGWPGWRDIPLGDLLREKFGLPVVIDNDANAAGLAEFRFGAGRGFRSVLYITLSTGIGAGIILDGAIYHGRTGLAGEVGHVSVDYRSQVICGCGSRGCIEALCSGAAIAAGYEFDELTRRLGVWMGGLVSVLDPEIVIVGGGLTNLDGLLDRLRATIPAYTVNPYASTLPVEAAALGGEVGVYGAAAIALDALGRV